MPRATSCCAREGAWWARCRRKRITSSSARRRAPRQPMRSGWAWRSSTRPLFSRSCVRHDRSVIRLALVAVLLCAGCIGATTPSGAPIEQRAPGTWATRAPAPVPRQEVAVAAHEGHVWVIGGFDARATPDNKVESYDPVADTWHERAPLPVSLHHAAAAVVDGRLFVIGGYTGGRMRWTPLA